MVDFTDPIFLDNLPQFIGASSSSNQVTDHPFSRKQLHLHLYYNEYLKMDPSQLSNFDPASFLDATVTEASISRQPLPANRDFIAVLGEPKMRAWKSKDGLKAGMACDINHEFEIAAMPPDVQALYQGKDGAPGLTKVIIQDGIMLDLTDNGMIDLAPGKNGRLRQYREALGLNEAGQPFNLRMLQGRNIRSKIKHEPYEGNLYDKIASVAKV